MEWRDASLVVLQQKDYMLTLHAATGVGCLRQMKAFSMLQKVADRNDKYEYIIFPFFFYFISAVKDTDLKLVTLDLPLFLD